MIEGISATDTTTTNASASASANANNNSSKAPPPPTTTAAATVNSTTLNTSSSSVNSTTAAVKSIEEQLAEAAAAKERRRLEMSTGSLNGGNGGSTLGKVVNSIKSADHETIRLALVTLALVSSFFGALVLVMAGADPPTASSGSLYTYADLMRLMTAVHERSVEIVPNSLSRREWIEALKNGTLMETTAEKWRELLGEWFPIRRVDFQTTDAILRDGNFYAEHYGTFQGSFIFFACLGQAVLLLSWAYFLVAKELRAGRRHREELRFRVNGHGNGNAKSRVKSPKLLSERVGEAWAKTRRVFGGGDQNSSLKRLKRSWFDDCSEKKLWKRPVVLVVGGILFTDLLVFTVLMVRPNSFTLVLHQVVFVLLAVVCLALTQAKAEEKLHFQNKRFNGRSSSLLSRETPRSLRATTNGANSYPSHQRNGRNKVHQSPAELITAEPLIIEEAEVSGTATPIFVTEQSALNVHKLSSSYQPPPSPQPSLNPFGSFDEEEEEERKKTSPTKKKKEKRQSIDEEAEKEVEQV